MDVFKLAEEIKQAVSNYQAATKEEVEKYRIEFLGTKGKLKELFANFGHVPNERKKEFGQLANGVKQFAEQKFSELKDKLEQSADTPTDVPDLTRPASLQKVGTRHPISIVRNEMIAIFNRIGFTVAEGPEIEDDWHNFTALNTPEDHPARDMQDTFYIEQTHPAMLLRTHTSPVQARTMKTQKPPIRIIAPGRVYRNETISARAHCQFHQVEGLYIDENVSFVDLKQTLLYFAREMFGQHTEIRLRPSFFPFTEPSAEMDVTCLICKGDGCSVCKHTGWVEVLGCGMVDPNVLEICGIDSEKYTGFAFGMGVERIAMMRYQIKDIRLFFENDVRFLEQFKPIF